MHVVPFLNRCVCAGVHECRSLRMGVERAATLDPLHFLTTTVTNCPRTFRPRAPLLDALPIFISPWEAALPANTLALVVYSWEPTRGKGWNTSCPSHRASRWSGGHRRAL